MDYCAFMNMYECEKDNHQFYDILDKLEEHFEHFEGDED
jgi:hypothetical protein